MSEHNNSDKIILDLCGGTGSWSLPYKESGYVVYNITLPEYDLMKCHVDFSDRDGIWFLGRYSESKKIWQNTALDEIYGILAAPPCEQFSFVRTTPKIPRNLRKGMELVIKCLEIIWACQYDYKNQHQKLSNLKFWALENPYFGSLKWFLGKPAFIFQSYEFGDMYKKQTALWGNFKEPKRLDKFSKPDIVKFDKLLMQQIRELKSPVNEDAGNPKTRKELRAITPQGFSKAFYEANK